MNLEELRAELAGIVAKLDAFKGVENLTDADVDSINALSDEFEATNKKIETAEKLERVTAIAGASAKKTKAPVANVTVKPSTVDKNGGFKNFGDFLMSVKEASAGNVDRRFQNTLFERDGSSGGYLVPEEMLDSVAKKIGSDESLLSRTKQFSVSGNSLTLPVDEKQPWNGGVQAYWTAEGAPITESGSAFGQASLKLNKLAALVKCSDELLEDSVALESYIREMAPVAITHKLNNAIISGDGVGKMQGILNSGFKIAIAKEVGQTADTVVAENIVKMYSAMIPSARANAVWYIHPEVEAQLRLMKDGAGNYIYLAPGSQLNQSPYGVLMGRPVLPLLGAMKQLGDEGDIIFASLDYYYSIVKTGGLQSAMSTHLYFDQAISAFRFTFRVDGKCPFKAPVEVENGDYKLSAFITLADRA